MGKISNELAGLIKTAMLNKESDRLQVIRNIKAKFLEFKTSRDGVNKLINGEITDADEITLIKKMIKERKNDVETYTGRQNLIDEANYEISVLETFVPKSATEDEILSVINDWISSNGEISQKQMGLVIKDVKSKLPNADGKTVSVLVKSKIS